MHNIRQKNICDYIESRQIVTMKELQKLCPDVSLMTIHRDLDALQSAGDIVKFRGGARSVRHTGDLSYEVRLQENNQGKVLMAQKALKMIRPGSAVFLDAGTTNLMLAKAMPDMNLRVFTTDPNIAVELCRLQQPEITVCCGKVNRKNMAISGHNTVEMLRTINLDVAFIGVSGCSVEAGFTCGTEGDMAVKNMVMSKAKTTVIMCDRGKFKCLMPYTFAQFAGVDYLISDGAVPEAVACKAKENGVTVL